MPFQYDIAIIGAGAAGLTAAIFARAEAPSARIVLLDGAPKIGAKILIAGGGRCNVTHDVVTPDDFNGNRNAIAKVLRTRSEEHTSELQSQSNLVCRLLLEKKKKKKKKTKT